MATAPTYNQPSVDQYGMPAEPKKGSGCVKGCLIVLVVLVVLGLILGAVVWMNWRSWTAGAMSQAFNQMVDKSSMPDQEKTEVKAEIDRAVQAFRNGTLSMEKFGMMMQELIASPLMPMMMVSSAESELNKSGLSAEEKAAGQKTIRRFNRGLFDKKIPKDAADTVVRHVANQGPNGEWQPRQQISDEQLKSFLEAAKAEVDKAQIADDPDPVDISAELKRIIDTALGGQ